MKKARKAMAIRATVTSGDYFALDDIGSEGDVEFPLVLRIARQRFAHG